MRSAEIDVSHDRIASRLLVARRQTNQLIVVLASIGVAALTCAWRIMAFVGFENDHYVHLARTQQLLLGAWPIRDFVDPGMPLMYVSSALAALIGGETIMTELMFVVAAFALSAALTVRVATKLSGSVAIAVVVTLLEMAVFPRMYSYPKILLYVAGAWAIVAVAEEPSRRRVLALAALVAVAFLFRHDHGIYLGLASMVMVVLRTRADGWLTSAARVGTFAGAVAVLLLPWAIYVALMGGVVDYFRSAIEFSRAEAVGTRLTPPRFRLSPSQGLVRLRTVERPIVQVEWTTETNDATRRAVEQRYGLQPVESQSATRWAYHASRGAATQVRALIAEPHVVDTNGFGRLERPAWREFLAWASPARLEAAPGLYPDENSEAWLFYLFRFLPLICVVLAVWRLGTRRESWTGESSAVASLALLAAAVNAGFLRDVLSTRLPDAIVPPALLAAWLLGRVWTLQPRAGAIRRLARVAAAVTVALTTLAIVRIADTIEQVNRTGVLGGIDGLQQRARALAADLRNERTENLIPSRVARGLLPFYGYFDRCTAGSDRLLVTSLVPDVFVFARRGFAGGHVAFIEGYYTSTREQTRTLDQIRRESVPFALVSLETYDAFRRSFPLIEGLLSKRYHVLADIPVEQIEGIRVFVERDRRAQRVDPATGWPCFR